MSVIPINIAIVNSKVCPSFIMAKVPPKFTVVVPLADTLMFGCFPTLRLPR
tara:strand:+ start:2035 stop:2187 length:153 start_codon:yes stop_codon:yes gene_type:complete